MDIFIYGVITEDTPIFIQQQLAQLPDTEETVNVRFDTPGGSYFAGSTIQSILETLPNPVNGFVDGKAFSAGALALMGVPKENRKMSPLSMLMIHNAISPQGGNKENLAAKEEFLGKVDLLQLEIFNRNMNARKREVKAMMEKTTYFTPAEAIEVGLVSGTFDSIPVAALEQLITSNNMEEQKKENVFSSARDFIEARLTDLNILKDEKAKEAEIVEKLKESDDQLKEEIQAEETERVKDLSGADILTAKMVPYAQYRLDLQKRDEVIEAMYAEYISLPTKAEVEDQIKAEVDIKVSAKLDELLKNLKSQSEGLAPNEKFDIYKEPEDEAKEIKAQYDEFEAWKKERETTK